MADCQRRSLDQKETAPHPKQRKSVQRESIDGILVKVIWFQLLSYLDLLVSPAFFFFLNNFSHAMWHVGS